LSAFRPQHAVRIFQLVQPSGCLIPLSLDFVVLVFEVGCLFGGVLADWYSPGRHAELPRLVISWVCGRGERYY